MFKAFSVANLSILYLKSAIQIMVPHRFTKYSRLHSTLFFIQKSVRFYIGVE